MSQAWGVTSQDWKWIASSPQSGISDTSVFPSLSSPQTLGPAVCYRALQTLFCPWPNWFLHYSTFVKRIAPLEVSWEGGAVCDPRSAFGSGFLCPELPALHSKQLGLSPPFLFWGLAVRVRGKGWCSRWRKINHTSKALGWHLGTLEGNFSELRVWKQTTSRSKKYLMVWRSKAFLLRFAPMHTNCNISH